MGNRGCLHKDGEIVVQSKEDAWITCVTEVKPGGEKRPLMEGNHYTVLFFLDEATALAAGHRPCWDCRRSRYDAFKKEFGAANRPGIETLARNMDALLKADRHPAARQQIGSLHGLPDGVIVKHVASGAYYLILGEKVYPWSFDGYGAAISRVSIDGPFIILTPACTVNAIRHGYRPDIHPSAPRIT